jgi:hypothetical protein
MFTWGGGYGRTFPSDARATYEPLPRTELQYNNGLANSANVVEGTGVDQGGKTDGWRDLPGSANASSWIVEGTSDAGAVRTRRRFPNPDSPSG